MPTTVDGVNGMSKLSTVSVRVYYNIRERFITHAPHPLPLPFYLSHSHTTAKTHKNSVSLLDCHYSGTVNEPNIIRQHVWRSLPVGHTSGAATAVFIRSIPIAPNVFDVFSATRVSI